MSYKLIFAPEETIKSNVEAKLHKLCLWGQGQSVESEKSWTLVLGSMEKIHMSKMDTTATTPSKKI